MDNATEQARQLFRSGNDFFEARRFAEARSAFAAALALVPGRPSVLSNLAVTHFHLGEFSEARTLLKQVLAIEPGNHANWVCLGLCEEALENHREAAECLEKGLPADPRADLWLICSECHSRIGHLPAALTAVDRALRIAPELAQAWSARGNLLREMQDYSEAARSFEKALSFGADAALNRYYLASVRGENNPDGPPRQYIEALFDSYAADFETHLVEGLRYRGHDTLVRPLLAAGKAYPTALDLGCGTGLCATLLASIVKHVDGVDLSAAMLAKARQRNIYRHLRHDDLASFLTSTDACYDLIVAADVFGYVGDLSGIFRAARRRLNPNGCFAFTVEKSAATDSFDLRPNLRYAHGEAYVRRLANQTGFQVRELFTETLRHDQAAATAALYVYLE